MAVVDDDEVRALLAGAHPSLRNAFRAATERLQAEIEGGGPAVTWVPSRKLDGGPFTFSYPTYAVRGRRAVPYRP